ncbi:MAG: hypothetical protein M3Y72_13730 [Acidobacteriota bacterium]|nr:hypothetical protein [Acidobacteriota bacterium]
MAPDASSRQQAFHRVLARYKLSDPAMQAGVVQLLNRESNDLKWEELDEEIWYENYYGDVWELCRKIAIQYDNQDAWHAILYANYNEDSSWGLGLAAAPAAFHLLVEMAHDSRSFYASRGTRLLAEALVRCYAPAAPNCSAVLAKKQQILALIRERLSSPHEDLSVPATVVLGVSGTKEDIPFLKERSQKVKLERAGDEHAAQDKQAVLWLLELSITDIELREARAQSN